MNFQLLSTVNLGQLKYMYQPCLYGCTVQRPQKNDEWFKLLIFYVILYSHLQRKNVFLARSKACKKNMSKQGKMFFLVNSHRADQSRRLFYLVSYKSETSLRTSDVKNMKKDKNSYWINHFWIDRCYNGIPRCKNSLFR